MTQSVDFDELVKRIRKTQDREAFTIVFNHFAPRLSAYLYRLGTEPALGEEIVQDVMTTLWRKAALFDPSKSSVATWLFRIARNRRIDLLRRDRSTELKDDNPYFTLTVDDNTEAVIDERSRQERVQVALQALPAEQLELVRLAFFADLSHSEIAKRTGLPLGTVKSRIRLAFGRLRHILESDKAVDPPSA